MPLNLSVGEGDFTPYLKYNAKAGRFYVKPEGATEEVEIHNPVLAFDMANIKTGWLYYAEGSGPEKIWDPSQSQMAQRPPGPKKFKRGFEVMVSGNSNIPGTNTRLGLREFSSTAGNVISAILRMHAEYEAGAPQYPDCVPVYSCDNVKPINGAYGVNYEPMFSLKMWVPRIKVPDFDQVTTHEQQRPATNGTQHTVTDAVSYADRGGYSINAPAPSPRADHDPSKPRPSMKDGLEEIIGRSPSQDAPF